MASPDAIYDRPQTRFVAEFIGETNLFAGRLEARDGDKARIRLDNGSLLEAVAPSDLATGSDVLVSIRPERVGLAETAGPANAVPVKVLDTVYQGDHLRARVSGSGLDMVAKLARKSRAWPVGAQAFATFQPDECTVIRP